MLGQEFICEEETGDNLAKKGKATHMADHGVSQAGFLKAKINFLVKINKPKFANVL